MADNPILTPEQIAIQIIDAIPGALGMRPDPWPCKTSDGEPHKTVAKIVADSHEALRARAAELERGLSDIAERLQTGGMTDVWFLAGQVKGLIEHVEQARQRAAEDAATIKRLTVMLEHAEPTDG